MNVARPVLRGVPTTILFNHAFTVPVDIPAGIRATDVKGASPSDAIRILKVNTISSRAN